MFQEPAPANIPITEWIKIAAPVGTLVISIINLILTITLFRLKDRKENRDSERKIKIDWFKTLILDNNLQYFHDFFDNIEKELEKLKSDNINVEKKQKVDEKIKDFQRTFRIKFIDTLLAVDKSLYDNILKIADNLVDDFTNSIFDSGINLNHPPKFEEIVIKKISESKTDMISEIFKYKGESLPSDKIVKR